MTHPKRALATAMAWQSELEAAIHEYQAAHARLVVATGAEHAARQHEAMGAKHKAHVALDQLLTHRAAGIDQVLKVNTERKAG